MDFANLPAHVVARARKICLAFPESEESEAPLGVGFRIRRRLFAHLFSIATPEDDHVTMLVCRADPEEREVLREIGHPFFIPRSGRDRVGVLIDDNTDWTEVAELVTESYRILAPKKLAAIVDATPT